MVRIASILRLVVSFIQKWADIGSLINSLSNQMNGYLRIGFRKELVDPISFKNILKNIIAELDHREADQVLNGVTWYFITGKKLDPKYLMEEKEEELSTKVEGLSPTDRMWQEGFGLKLETMLRGELPKILRSKKIFSDRQKEIIDQIVSREPHELDREVKDIFEKVRADFIAMISSFLITRFENEKGKILEKLKVTTGLETLEPAPFQKDKERGTTLERVDPGFDKPGEVPVGGISIEEIYKWVKTVFSPVEVLIFENIISKEPLSETELNKDIEKQTGKQITRQTINNYIKKIIDRIHEKFYSHYTREEGLGDINVIIEKMSPADLKNFEEYLLEDIKKTEESKARKPEVIERVTKLFKGLSEKKLLKNIAQEFGETESILKKDVNEIIKPAYKKWRKEHKTAEILALASIRLAMALHRGYLTMDKVSSMIQDLAGVLGIDRDVSSAGKDQGIGLAYSLVTGAEPVEPDPEGEEGDDTDPIEKIPGGSSDDPTEKALDTALLEAEKKKEIHDIKVREELTALINKKILNRSAPEFRIYVKFHSKFDIYETDLVWVEHFKSRGFDIETTHPKAKYKPRVDNQGAFVKDDPEFKWDSFFVTINKGLTKSKHMLYTFDQKLMDNGTLEGAPKSSLVITNTTKKGSDNIVDEPIGSHPFFRQFLDDVFKDLAKTLPVSEGLGYSVKYENQETKEVYTNTKNFENAMGGLAISSEGKQERIKWFKKLQELKEKHDYGHGVSITEEFRPGVVRRELRNLADEPGVQDSDRDKIKEYLQRMKNKLTSEDVTEIQKFIVDLNEKVHEHYQRHRSKE